MVAEGEKYRFQHYDPACERRGKALDLRESVQGSLVARHHEQARFGRRSKELGLTDIDPLDRD